MPPFGLFFNIKCCFMKKYSLLITFIACLTTVLFQTSLAQTSAVNVVTTAVPFLRINPDPRGGAMGDAGIATPSDVNDQFWNLAKTPFNKMGTAIGFTYTPWLQDLGLTDVYLASLAGYRQVSDDQAFSYNLRYFSLGNIQFTDYSGNLLNSYNPHEFTIGGGYSRKLSPNLGIAAALRYINSSLVAGSVNGVNYKAGSAFAGDISLFYTELVSEGNTLNWGVTLTNLGSKIGYTDNAQDKDYIPANLGLGIAYTTELDNNSKITYTLDMNKLLVPAAPAASNPTNSSVDSANLAAYRNSSVMSSWFKSFADGTKQIQSLQFAAGLEYTYDEQFMLRAGYHYGNANAGNLQYLALGIGLKYSGIGINFSYLVPSGNGVTRNPLSNTMRFGVNFDLEKSDSHKN